MEVSYTPSGTAVANLSVATNERWKDKQGKPQERTEWHRVQLWDDTAINASKYLKKGSSVYVEGRIRSREYMDKENIKRFIVEIACDRLMYLDPREGGEPRPLPGQHREEQAGAHDDELF